MLSDKVYVTMNEQELQEVDCTCGHCGHKFSATPQAKHIVACVDSTDRATVEGLIAGRKVGMVVADPPYGMKLDTDYTGHALSPAARAKHPTQNNHPPVLGDDQDFDPVSYFEMFVGVQEQFWWGADYYRKHLPDGGSWLVWDKRASVEQVEYDTSSFELCWSKTPHRRDILRIPWFGIIGMEQEKGKRVHPTQKPISIYEALYGIVAAALKAAEPMDRMVIGCELSPHYIDHIIEWGEAHNLVCERVSDASD
jgi:DNA modification methylase